MLNPFSSFFFFFLPDHFKWKQRKEKEKMLSLWSFFYILKIFILGVFGKCKNDRVNSIDVGEFKIARISPFSLVKEISFWMKWINAKSGLIL